MKNFYLFFALVLLFFSPKQIFAQTSLSFEKVSPSTQKSEYFRAKVIKITDEGVKKIVDTSNPFQKLVVKIVGGKENGKEIKVEHGTFYTIRDFQKVKLGDEIVLSKNLDIKNKPFYTITDKYRIPPVILIATIFFGIVIFFARLKGLMSIISMILSIFILLKFIVPAILSGQDPITVTLTGAFGITFFSLYLAHGFNKRITIAVVCTLISLVISVVLAQIFVTLASLTGAASDEAYYIQAGVNMLNLKGLFLGGIIIGALGVLDDITTGQTAAIDEIHKTDPTLSAKDLYKKGISIGKEHISSLVNTLVLAYAGASLPIFLLFILLQNQQPLWVVLNSEFVIEEFVRTLVGSTTLVIAVPLTTFVASVIYGKKSKN